MKSSPIKSRAIGSVASKESISEANHKKIRSFNQTVRPFASKISIVKRGLSNASIESTKHDNNLVHQIDDIDYCIFESSYENSVSSDYDLTKKEKLTRFLKRENKFALSTIVDRLDIVRMKYSADKFMK